MMSIGELVYEKRRLKGYTQTKLGELCGYKGLSAKVTVQNWEHGRALIPIDKVRKVSEVLGIPIQHLVP